MNEEIRQLMRLGLSESAAELILNNTRALQQKLISAEKERDELKKENEKLQYSYPISSTEEEVRQLLKDKERLELIDKGIWDIRYNDRETCFEIHNEAYTLIGCGSDIRTAIDMTTQTTSSAVPTVAVDIAVPNSDHTVTTKWKVARNAVKSCETCKWWSIKDHCERPYSMIGGCKLEGNRYWHPKQDKSCETCKFNIDMVDSIFRGCHYEADDSTYCRGEKDYPLWQAKEEKS